MKTILNIVLSVLLPVLVSGQIQPWCGFEMTDEQESDYFRMVRESREFTLAGKESMPTIYIPVQFHAVGTTAGEGFVSTRTMLSILCELNSHFSPVGFVFWLYGIKYIKNDNYNNGNVNGMFNNNVNKVVNVYIAESAGAGLCGYFTWNGDAVVMKKDCALSGDRTFPHEMGHYFYLAHTFNNFDAADLYNSEWVTRVLGIRNCEDEGDGFCDTDADYLDYRWNCIGAVHTQKDYRNDTYNPDETLYMSYSDDNCINRFSTQQKNSMIYVVNYYRSELKQHTVPNASAITSVPNHILPAADEVDVPANYITFEWDAVPGADSYHLIATRFNINSDYKLALDVIVDGTSYTAIQDPDFEEYQFYDWKVKPINDGNTCSGYSVMTSFMTGENIAISGIGDGFTAVGSLHFLPNPVKEKAPLLFTYSSAHAFDAEIHIYNINGRKVFSRMISVDAGQKLYSVPAGNLTPGMFFFTLTGPSATSSRSFIVTGK